MLEFINEVRKIQFPKKGNGLTALEKSGDVQALAVAFSNFKPEKEMRAIGSPRASSLYDACMRKQVIGTCLELEEPKWIDLRTRLVYGIGTAVHDRIQNTGMLFGEGRYGWWFCRGCRQVRYFGAPPKMKCEKCGAHQDASVYMEHSLRIKKPVIVSGHPDMYFRPTNMKKVRVAEIKTMGGDEYDKLVAPRVMDEWQIHTYMWGSQLDPTLQVPVDSEVGYVVYVTKRLKEGIFPLKIFPVLWNADLVKRIRAKLTMYKEGIKEYPKNLPPALDECSRSKFDSYRAKSCVARKECIRNYGA